MAKTTKSARKKAHKQTRASAKTKREAATAAASTLTTGEATVAALLANGMNTLYALPGVHNDHFFDAVQRAGDAIRTVHTRHEQGAAYMALGAALATGKPQPYAVVPGPGLLNSGAALLTAYGMNAPVLGLIGQIPDAAIGKAQGHLHEITDQAGIVARLADFSGYIKRPADAAPLVNKALRSMLYGKRPGPAVLECAIDVWGQKGPVAPIATLLPPRPRPIDEDALRKAARILGAGKRILIVAGGGALDAAEEVTALSEALQAPVLAYRRGRGVIDGRSPFSVTLPLGHELWAEADVILGIGTRMLMPVREWGVDRDLKIVRIDTNPDETTRLVRPNAAVIGDAAEVVKKLLDVLPRFNQKRASRRAEMEQRQARMAERLRKIAPQLAFVDAIRAALPDDGIYVDEVTQIGFAARLGFPVFKPRTFLSPGYQDNLGWGFATALGAQDARRDVPVVSINGDGGFMYTANELATAIRHRIPLTAVVFADGAFGNVRRIQQEHYGNRLIACDLANPDFVKFAESFGAVGRRVRDAGALQTALTESFARREPTLIEVPVGAFPSPWEFIHMPRVRGR
ncbi:MAG: acetolactate synthase [Rhizobiales bacterium]|nr:acetolactate synthase [Hyphomicrobiales bacterium]